MVSASNHFLPILEKSPFPTSLIVGEKVKIRSDVLVGYERWEDGWEVVGYRHDLKTSRQYLIVLRKNEKTINMYEHHVRKTAQN